MGPTQIQANTLYFLAIIQQDTQGTLWCRTDNSSLELSISIDLYTSYLRD